ncbi:HlyD family secretion protein [Rosistilla oblonga]|uniref:HlyD family secretion protein n=1 Tax=Rosistilla oblonga TaxID=2527990 RepID=UPI003A971A27
MIAFMLTIYVAVVVLLFKMKLVKPNPYPIALILVAGIFVIGGPAVAWTLSAPVSPRVVTTQYVVQLVPYVKGQVAKVHAQANVPMKKGDLLLEINPTPYQNALDQATAQLQAAREGLKQAEAGVDVAKASVASAAAGVQQATAAVGQSKAVVSNALASIKRAKAGIASAEAGVTKAKAADDLAKTEEQIAVNLQKTDAGAISALRVTQAVQSRQAADAALQAAETGVNEAQAALLQAEAGLSQSQAAEQQAAAGLVAAQAVQQQADASESQAMLGVKIAASKVQAAEAQVSDAQFNLGQCKMLAPADGYVVNWTVQEGTMLVPVPLAAAGTFINTEQTFIVASYPQNWLMNVESGDDVELVLNPFPGRLFKGKVDQVIPATGEGQFDPSKSVPLASQVGSHGFLAVKILLDQDQTVPSLPLGAGGTVAIYTDHGKPVHIISKVAIRMQKWLLYIMPS